MARRKDPVLPEALLDRLPGGVDAKSAFDGGGRNGYGKKTVLTEGGSLELSIPRDRPSSFDPQLVAKGPRRFPGVDDGFWGQKFPAIGQRGRRARQEVLPCFAFPKDVR